MNIPRLLTTFGVVLAFAVALFADETAKTDEKKTGKAPKPEGIRWLSYADAVETSRTEEKHMLIHFTRKGCGWCRLMEKNTYTDSDVIKTVNGHFAPTVIWGDSRKQLDIEGYKITERNLAVREFGVTGYPEFWFVSPERVKVGPLKGYLTADRFVKALEYVKDYKYDTTRTRESQAGAEDGK